MRTLEATGARSREAEKPVTSRKSKKPATSPEAERRDGLEAQGRIGNDTKNLKRKKRLATKERISMCSNGNGG